MRIISAFHGILHVFQLNTRENGDDFRQNFVGSNLLDVAGMKPITPVLACVDIT